MRVQLEREYQGLIELADIQSLNDEITKIKDATNSREVLFTITIHLDANPMIRTIDDVWLANEKTEKEWTEEEKELIMKRVKIFIESENIQQENKENEIK